jgi:hypothetical protein
MLNRCKLDMLCADNEQIMSILNFFHLKGHVPIHPKRLSHIALRVYHIHAREKSDSKMAIQYAVSTIKLKNLQNIFAKECFFVDISSY